MDDLKDLINTLDAIPTPDPLRQRAIKHLKEYLRLKPARSIAQVILCPNTDEHLTLAKKFAEARNGEILPLTQNEIALSMDFQVWPPKLTESF